MKKLVVVSLVILVGCAATTQQPQTPPPQAAQQSQYKNLQVLPKDISREELLATMRSFTRGLGVRCNHCHVVTATEPKEELDFALDTKEEKRNARVMLRMVMDINRNWMTRLDDGKEEFSPTRVTCWTCHRGMPEPEDPPPPPAQPARPGA